MFEGPEFPQNDVENYESHSFEIICDFIIEQFICVDPLDKMSKLFQVRQKKCSEVTDLITKRFKEDKRYA